MCDAIIIGAAIADILLSPVDESVFARGSCAVECVRMGFGGDALNESIVLRRLGHAPMLATKLGEDAVAELICEHLSKLGVKLHAIRDAALDTGINAVLVHPNAERSFITNRNGSLRRLSLADALSAFEEEEFESARVVCLASMFVSPQLSLAQMEALFSRAKAAGKIVCADTTKCKNGETLRDAAAALRQLDYFFPNWEEAQLLTGERDPDAIADALLKAGVGCVALKLGKDGCLIATGERRMRVPAYPKTECIDTTGAGDTFAAAFIAGILEEKRLLECAAQANAAASLCAESLGATAAEMCMDELKRRMQCILDAC